MADMDMIPVRDPGGGRGLNDAGIEQKSAQQKRMVSKWDRDILEDKYLRLYEENLIIKKHARKQEEKIKRMATKLLRLVNDKKKTSENEVIEGKGKKGRDIEMEEKLEELHDKIRALEKQNHQLKDKLTLSKQQLATNAKRQTPYDHVGSRISTGIAKTAPHPDPRLAKNMRVTGPMESPQRISRVHSPTQQRYGHSLLENARVELTRKDDHIGQLQEQLNICEMEIENMRQQLKLKDAAHDEDLARIKQQITAEQRVSVQENIDMIKLQREVKEKSMKLHALEEKYRALEQNTHTVKHGHDTLLMEMEKLNMQLKEEQNRVLTLQNELKFGTTNNRKLIELQEQANSLEKENQILKEANEKFVSSAFDLEREREWRQREHQLKVQIAQLEATLKADLGEKGGILDRLASERDDNEKAQKELRELQIQHYQLKEEYDDLQEKMKFFTKESAIDFTEIEEALVLVKQRKQKELPPPDFLKKVDEERSKDAKKELLEIQAEYAETVHELEKTRNMLVIQHKINKDYQQEVNIATSKLEETKKEYEMKLDEYARLLDIRAARIKKLESQLRDVAYGTKQMKIPPPTEEEDALVEFDETIHLERGQNLFEVHIHKVILSDEGIKYFGDEEPSVFCTWEFFEFEIQSTPVMKGPRPEYDFTSQYVVTVDDFFLHYLQKDSCTLELHQSFGQDYRTVAACQLRFHDIFDKTHGRIHGVATLTCMDPNNTGISLGTVEYWIRLRVPMDQALRLYKERTKALGYIATNERATGEALKALDDAAATRPPDNVNELHVKVIRCSKLKPRRGDVQPSPYVIYQFFDFNDHDSAIIPNSNNPEFNDHKTFPVPMTKELDTYLKTIPLKFFVFDDTDPEQTAYLGIADVPLIPLAHNKAIQGLFELKSSTGQVNGTIELQMYWQYTYVQPKGVKIQEPPVSDQIGATKATPTATPTPSPPQEREEPVTAEVVTPVKQRPKMAARFPDPQAHSTPMVQPLEAQEGEPAKKIPKRRLQDDLNNQDSMVNEAVKGVISAIMPSTSESMSETLPEQPKKQTSEDQVISSDVIEEDEEEGEISEDVEDEAMESDTDDRDLVQGKTGHKVSPVTSPKVKTPSPPHSVSGSDRGQEMKDDTIRSKKEDTMFGDEEEEEEVEEEITEEITEEAGDSTLTSQGDTLKSLPPAPAPAPPPADESSHESDVPQVVESDSEGVNVVVPRPSKRGQKSAVKRGNLVTVTIHHLTLEPDSSVMKNQNITQLFVAYNFLGVELQELETPFSLPKPSPTRPDQTLQYNFSKTFHVDIEKNYTRRQYLASMLLPDDPDQGRIKFSIVSEPPDEDQTGNCEDVASAYASVKDILRTGKDVVERDVDVVDCHDETKVVGSLNITVECLEALRAVEREMLVDGTI